MLARPRCHQAAVDGCAPGQRGRRLCMAEADRTALDAHAQPPQPPQQHQNLGRRCAPWPWPGGQRASRAVGRRRGDLGRAAGAQRLVEGPSCNVRGHHEAMRGPFHRR